MTVLEDLWYGNIHPVELFLEENQGYKSLLRIVAKNQEILSASLSPEQAALFEKYDSTVKEMHTVAEVAAFSYGFRLGVQLMTEADGDLNK